MRVHDRQVHGPGRADLERRHGPADGPSREPVTDLGPAGIAGVLCGAHAQVLSAAELSIGRRIAGATRADVQRALWQERALVKTFGPRGTIHLLPTADLPMWTGALSALPSSVPAHPEGVRFTPKQADEVIAAIGDALADAELTVDELTEVIADHHHADPSAPAPYRRLGERSPIRLPLLSVMPSINVGRRLGAA
jgi:Winged helix DNA-binding domain